MIRFIDLTFKTSTGWPQTHLSRGFVAWVENGTDPSQTKQRKFKVSSLISCINGQFSVQGMHWQSNQYCFFSLAFKYKNVS